MPDVKSWNSELYLEFEKERMRAARDLLAQIPAMQPRKVFDLGCGPGTSTQLLVERFPGACVTGVDISCDMLAAARLRAPTAHFVEEDIGEWRPDAPADLIFANASLHFLADHKAGLCELLGMLADDGVLAVQMPDNIHEVSHALMRMVAVDGPWASRLVPIAKTRTFVGAVEEYYDLLAARSAAIDIWRTVYLHPLNDVDDVVRWFEGSGLRPFLDALDPVSRPSFLARYRAALAAAYRPQTDGRILLSYPRIFLIVRRA
jgi:trans-aconitate 2-methyltransferase